MKDYGQINSLWEKNLENVAEFSKVIQQQTTKALTQQTNTLVEGVNIGVNLTQTITTEWTKNVMAIGEMWSTALQTTMNSAVKKYSTDQE